MPTFHSQARQDEFVLWCLDNKRGGTFVEIGSNEPITINNTYVLEKEFGWRGLMLEYEARFLPKYKEHRPNSMYMIEDASEVDYCAAFEWANLPREIDYLQIDLEADNRSTLKALEHVEKAMEVGYTFKVVTFEHDIYRGDFFNTRLSSRAIFEKHGYIRLFSDICNDNLPFEDWYIHSSLCGDEVWGPLVSTVSEESTNVMGRLYGARDSMTVGLD